MPSFKSSAFVLSAITALGLASGAAFAQSQAPSSTDKAKVQKPVQTAGLSDRAMARSDAATRPVTRDWGQIDTNKDNLISPEEMEAYLKANPGPLATAK